MNDAHLFHITDARAWENAKVVGEYRAASLATQGFIHLSLDRQWVATVNRFYRGVAGLVLLRLQTDRLRAEIRYEPADGDTFPHLYGPIDLDAVVAEHELVTRRFPSTPEFDTLLKRSDPSVEGVAICYVTTEERASLYVCLEAKGGSAGKISLRDLMQAAGTMRGAERPSGISAAAWLQLPSFPRRSDGSIDDQALVAVVQALAASD